MLSHLSAVIVMSHSIIIDQSWKVSQVHEDCRKADVNPVFKKGEKEEPGNYSLVSLTIIPWNVVE